VKKEQQQQQQEIEPPTVVSSSSAAAIPVTTRMCLKKEEEDNGHSKKTGDSNYNGPCHGSITVKKEEDENDDQQNSTNTPYTILSTTIVPDPAISSSSSNLNSSSRSGGTENDCSTKNNDDDDDDDDNHRFEKWESGNWCWLDDHTKSNDTTGCDIDTRVEKEEEEDNGSSFDTTTSGNDADDDTGVKKEVEEDTSDSSCKANNSRVKKEEGKNDNVKSFNTTNKIKNENENNCTRTAAAVSDNTIKSINNYHDDWTTGSWCWEVLPNLNSDGKSAVGSEAAASTITSTVAALIGTRSKRKLEQSQKNHKKKSKTIIQINKNNNSNNTNLDEDCISHGLNEDGNDGDDDDDDDDDATDDDVYYDDDGDDDDDDDDGDDDCNDGESECDESSWNSVTVTETTMKKGGQNVRHNHKEQWNKMYGRLVEYREQYKSTCVPRSYEADPQLATWVSTQRTTYNKLIAERKHKLNSIDFVWDSYDARWTEMYEQLVAYKNQYKSTCVPRSYEADPQLAKWVNRQRTNYNTNMPRLTTERKRRLNSIGFVWDLLDACWTEMYERLVAYKNQYKSTRVPISYEADPQLARWVSTQRTNYNRFRSRLTTDRAKKLYLDRAKKLDSIGFIWNAEK